MMLDEEKIIDLELKKEEKLIRNMLLLSKKRETADIEKVKMPSSEFIKKQIERLPRAIQLEMVADYERLLSYGVLGEEDINNEMAINYKKMQDNYEHGLLGMPNKRFAKYKVVQWIDEMTAENEDNDPDFLKKIARISLDLNGLKSVNDITHTHEKGDQYLGMVKKVLENKEFIQWLDDKKVQHVETADGGDEFGVILFGQEELSDDFLSVIMNKIKEELENMEESAEVLDFEDENVILAFGGVVKDDLETMSVQERAGKIQEIKKTIPEGYKYKAIISAGATTLYDSLSEIEIKDSDGYDELIFKAMGGIFDGSDKSMQENKEASKRGFEKSDDPAENMLAKIYSRTEIERRLQEEKNLLVLRSQYEVEKDRLFDVYITNNDSSILENIQILREKISNINRELDNI